MHRVIENYPKPQSNVIRRQGDAIYYYYCYYYYYYYNCRPHMYEYNAID